MHRVLVVDDEEFLADLVATALRYEGFETRTAGSGQAALAAVAAFRPDLLVLDVMLPDFSGRLSDEAVQPRGAGRQGASGAQTHGAGTRTGSVVRRPGGG